MLVGRLAAHVRRVQSCQNLDLAGVRPREAAGELKMHPFAAEKAFAQARNFSVDELREAIVRLADLDLALKGGSRLPPELELQRTLVAITRPELTREPHAGRPVMPQGYGVPETDEGLLTGVGRPSGSKPALNYWFATTRPDGRPHAMPAWARLARRQPLLRGQPGDAPRAQPRREPGR